MSKASWWEVRCGDCIEQMRELVGYETRYRVFFADPPYNQKVNYGRGRAVDNLPRDEFESWCRTWISLGSELLTEDGSMWVLVPDQWIGLVQGAMEAAGLHHRCIVVWHETFGVYRTNNFGKCSRFLCYMIKSKKDYVFNRQAVTVPSARQTVYNDKRAQRGGKIRGSVWTIPRVCGTYGERMKDFPTQLPLELLRLIVGCASDVGDWIIDPFSGSGTTGVACLEQKRNYVGIEQESKFCRLSRKRLDAV